MSSPVGDTLALLGIYLTLATLLVTSFFARLESWHASTVELRWAWRNRTERNMPADERQRHRDRYSRVRETMPWKGALLVALLLGVICLYAIKIMMRLDDPGIPLSYIYVPGAFCLGASVVSSIVLFFFGRRNLSEVEREMRGAKLIGA